jgi:magnesium chelatase family protein
VTVETHISNGLPSLAVVGLPETAVRESRERVRSAILNANLEFPARRITVNLAPAELPKVGGRYDLAIALSILAASGQIPVDRLEEREFLGELALGGELRGVSGVLPAAMRTRDSGRELIVPAQNRDEAALVRDSRCGYAADLNGIFTALFIGRALPSCQKGSIDFTARSDQPAVDLAAIKGQLRPKRALLIAAAGGHNLLLNGPPGTGKTLLASALPGILPPLTEEAALEVAAVKSIAGQKLKLDEFFRPPFRSPHHTATPVSLVGGGNRALPGEVSLAHHGVLFLDEFPEFNSKALEVLREPLEAGGITISRANHRISYPARFQLVAAMNPCPCGYHGDPSGKCRCTQPRIDNYQNKISGPLLDRIDLVVEVPRLSPDELTDAAEPGQNSATVRRAVKACRNRQLERAGKLNSALTGGELERYCRPDKQGKRLLQQAMTKLHLSARGYHRVLRLARTLADLEPQPAIKEEHLLEALGYRGQW